MLFKRQLLHDLRCQTGVQAVGVLLLILYIINASVDILHIALFFFQTVLSHCTLHSALSVFVCTKALLVDLPDQTAVSGLYNMPAHHHMGGIHVQRL